MFARRIFGSAPIPRTMYARLNISTATQASRMLPMLVPLSPSLISSSGAVVRCMQSAAKVSPSMELGEMDPMVLKALIESISPVQMGFLRLLELWGIGRACVMNRIQGISPLAQNSQDSLN